MVSIPQAILRFIQFIWIILITSLIGNVLAGKTGTNSTVNYAMYVAAYTWIAWFVGIAAIFVEGLAIPAVVFVLDLLAAIFTFVAGVVLAKKLEGAHSCNNDVGLHFPLPRTTYEAPVFCCALVLVPGNILTRHPELHFQQRHYARRRLAKKALPRAASLNRLLLVLVGLLHGFYGHFWAAG